MTSDRELLEAAAKAAGIKGEFGRWGWDELPAIAKDDGGLWRPLTDDGDALRLAVRLRLVVVVMNEGVRVSEHEGRSVYVADEPGVATRRAIVRAAAAIGRSKR